MACLHTNAFVCVACMTAVRLRLLWTVPPTASRYKASCREPLRGLLILRPVDPVRGCRPALPPRGLVACGGVRPLFSPGSGAGRAYALLLFTSPIKSKIKITPKFLFHSIFVCVLDSATHFIKNDEPRSLVSRTAACIDCVLKLGPTRVDPSH